MAGVSPAPLMIFLQVMDRLGGPSVRIVRMRYQLVSFIVLAAVSLAFHPLRAAERAPNFVVIFCDDLGYGDLGVFGHPTIRTPNLDSMAQEGVKLTQFYVAASVCTPSRAGLLTGRLPVRTGMCDDRRRVLFPDSSGGLPQSEITLAEALKERGYSTACVGKWHLGHLPEHLPTRHGFDEYFGLPYSNDMDRQPDSPRARASFDDPRSEYWYVPLIQGEKVIERPADQNTLTRRCTEYAVSFIQRHRERPFFLYLSHIMPHVPLFRSPEFADRSARGLYGDVIEEIDWSVGRVLEALRENGIDEHTLVIFTSDNGPWLVFDEQGGSAGLLREGKGSTWEGGMRVPTIARWPGRIEAGRVELGLGATLDLLPTFVSLAGGTLPDDVVLDGVDLTDMLLRGGPSPRESVFYYRGTRLFAVRHGNYKAHFITQSAYRSQGPVEHDPPQLFHLEHDPSETQDVAAAHPEVLKEIERVVAEHTAGLTAAPSQLTGRIGQSDEGR